MNNILLISLFIIAILIVGVLIWLVKEHLRFKQEFVVLSHTLERNNRDIEGLCSAAVSVDRRLSDNAENLLGMIEKVKDFDNQQQQTSQPYHSAIQKVRNGAKADELIELCGLSREEAALLIRLHSHDHS